jgi:pimeloyl-ACP methyl ester carboxylesterase
MRVFHHPGDPDAWCEQRARTLEAFQETAGRLEPSGSFFPQVDTIEETSLPGYLRRKIAFETEPDDPVGVFRLSAWLFIPRGRTVPLPAMLCLHQSTAAGKDQPAGLSRLPIDPPSLAYAAELAERGYVTLAPDFPGFGEARSMPPCPPGYASGTMKGIWNHRLAVDLLAALPEVDPGRLGVIGHSLGGHNSVFAAALDERLRVVISSCGFTSFPKYPGPMTAWAQPHYMPRIASAYGGDAARVPFDFSDLLCCLAPRLLLINAPLRDHNFHSDGVVDCVEIARQAYGLFDAESNLVLKCPDAAHEFPDEIRKYFFGRLDRHFGKV